QRGLVLLEDLADPSPSFDEFLRAREPGEERRNWFDRTVGYPRWAWLIERRRGAGIAPRPLPPLPEGGAREVEVALLPLRRGRLAFTGVTIARPDLFGLVNALVTIPLPGALVVLPKRYAVPDLALPRARKYQRGGVALAGAVGDAEEFVSLRDYRPGDPLRRVHWRSAARVGRPVVKEYQDEFFVRHALVLDTFAEHEERDVVERLRALGIPTRAFVVGEGPAPASGLDDEVQHLQVGRIAEGLARNGAGPHLVSGVGRSRAVPTARHPRSAPPSRRSLQ